MKIVADCDIPYLQGVLEPFADMHYGKGTELTATDIADADALIVRTRTRCDRALLEGSRIRLIVTATIGFDHIDIAYCQRVGIRVATAAGCNARGVLQWVGAVLVHLARQQGWQPAERILGIVGVGHVGSLVARYAAHWGFHVVCCDPPRQRTGELWTEENGQHSGTFISLDEVATQADIITFHTPLIRTGEDATFHLAGERFLQRVRPGTLLMNSSRGEVVDTRALIDAVESGRVACCIDTWEGEPEINRVLLQNALLATPHIAGYSAQGKANATATAVRTIAQQFGWPLTEWYPYDKVPQITPRLIGWDELLQTISSHYDIAAESIALKATPEAFEQMRNHYRYRQEYF